ncbi:MAG TPA: MmcQ/YjbR family DNA-binding protein [Acidimicrobiales bacterium]|nr:MmcQ/YjbR family DNA-binding protein [Acidimicrobiales bacterium]
MPRKTSAAAKWESLRKAALALPGTWEDHPWGEVVVKVGKKVFVFMGLPDADTVRVTVKLTEAHDHALSIPDAAPAGYGLGKSGWVFLPITSVEQDLLEECLEESYRNVAPKKLIAELDRA